MIERVSLFSSKKETLLFLLLLFFIFILSISFEFYSYKKFTAFDSQLVDTTILKQYMKTKLTKKGKLKEYQVLKLKSDSGLTFYTTASKNLPSLKEKKIELEIWAGDISFYEYLGTFFAFSKILETSQENSLKVQLTQNIKRQHKDENLSNIYEALFLASPLDRELQSRFSTLGISHLIAISGFHLGVLSALLFFIIKYPYRFLQDRYFPYRSQTRDSFFLISTLLLLYLLFLDMPPSLLRAYVMLVVGFILYDRGVVIISMQTLFLSVAIILALFPKLLFSLGFYLSVSGVFYLFLFLIHFKSLSKTLQFILLPFWIYLMMLPFSLAIFANFSLYHPLSILWTSLFSLFYPLALVLHLFGFGNLLDFMLNFLLNLDLTAHTINLSYWWLAVEGLLSVMALYKRNFAYLLLLYVVSIFIYSIYYVT